MKSLSTINYQLSTKLKLAFFGTPEPAAALLEKLSKIFDIQVVVTQEDKPVGRKKVLTPPPVKIIAESLKFPVLQPNKLKDQSFFEELRKYDFDVGVVVDYGKIIPENIINLPQKKIVNTHFSLLPKYRGACPVPFAIFRGEKVSGISLFVLEKSMDTGPIILQKEVNITENEDRDSLLNRMYEEAFEVLKNDLPKYVSGEILPISQNHEEASFCNFQNSSQVSTLLKNEDVRLDLTKSFQELDRQVRAFRNWLDSWTILGGKVLKIFRIKLSEFDAETNLEIDSEKNELKIKEGIDLNRLLAGHLKVLPSFKNRYGEIVEIEEFQLEGKSKVRLKL